MIRLEKVCKSYETRHGERQVLKDISLQLEKGCNVGILGRNGAGKSTLIRLLSGAEAPTSGRITRDMRISWPLAFSGAFHGNLSGLDNLKFICRIYGIDHKPVIPFVEEFTELGLYLREPVHHYSTGMISRLAFALCMAIEFDCFLIDEVLVVGDQRFHERCHHELFEKRRDRAFILVTHDQNSIRLYCQRACVLHEGRLHQFGNVDDAYNFFNETMLHAEPPQDA